MTTEVSYNRTWLYIGLAVQSIVIILLLLRSCNTPEIILHSGMVDNYDSVKLQGVFYTDDSGNMHFKHIDTMEHVTVADDKAGPIYETVIRVLDSAARQANAVVTKPLELPIPVITMVSYDSTPTLRKKIDSLNSFINRIKRFQNDYLYVNANTERIKDSIGTNDLFDYHYNAVIDAKQYSKRSDVLGLPLGTKSSYLDLTSKDPNATINGVKRFTIRQKQPEFGLRLQASTSYNPVTGGFNLGPTARIDIGRLSLSTSYYHNFQRDVWNPVITGYYDLVRFNR